MDWYSDFNPMKIMKYYDRLKAIHKFFTSKGQSQLPYPIMLEVDASNVCNFKCSFCQCWDMFNVPCEKHFITYDEWNKRIEPMIASGCGIEGVFFCGGGEPTIAPNFVEIVNSVAKHGISCSMTTNGSMVDKHMANAVGRAFKWVTMSIHASSEKTFNNYSGQKEGYFNKYIGNIVDFIAQMKSFDDNNTEISWKFVANEHNCHEIYDAYLLAYNCGFDKFILKPADISFERNTKNTFGNRYEHFYEHYKYYSNELKSKTIDGYEPITLDFQISEDSPYRDREYNCCYTAPLAPVIQPGGDISICCDMRNRYIVGDWKHSDSLLDYWGSEHHKEKLLKYSTVALSSCPKRCKMGRYNTIVNELFNKETVNPCFI